MLKTASTKTRNTIFKMLTSPALEIIPDVSQPINRKKKNTTLGEASLFAL